MVAKRPNSKRNLDIALRRMGGADEEYVRRRTLVANAVVGHLMPIGAVKGGSAMKIRFGDASTRASTDLDAARGEDLNTFVRELGDALAEGWYGFEGRISPREPAHPEDVPEGYVMRPYDVKMSYLGSPWCTVQLELGHNEIGDADDPDMVAPADANTILTSMGFPELGPVPTMTLHHQIAQKLHGATEPGSSRAHDLVDLQIIVARGEVDLEKTRETCERLFSYRRRQQWPPTVVKGDEWESLYAAQRGSTNVLEDVDSAVDWANNLIRRIADSR